MLIYVLKFSKIILVYNAEKYLLECVKSSDVPLSVGYEMISWMMD